MSEYLNNLITIRLSVGYLGEKSNFNWWNSEFMSSASDSFISPIFNRTTQLAKYNGVKEAAALKHDEYIGVGLVYHLFRLPEMLEQQLHEKVLEEKKRFNFTTNEEALAELEKLCDGINEKGEGPVYVGTIEELKVEKTMQKLAALYYSAFKSEFRVYPYFKDLDE